jgi:pimeloyl-ACP methyl ester carboxylesterase
MTTSSKRTGGGLRLVPITPEDPAAEPNRRAWVDHAYPRRQRPTPHRHPDAGHFLQEDQPARFAAVINRFIHLTT